MNSKIVRRIINSLIIMTMGIGIVYVKNQTPDTIEVKAYARINNDILDNGTNAQFIERMNTIEKELEEERQRLQEEVDKKQFEIEATIAENTRRNNVGFNYNDLTRPSNITAQDLHDTLLHFNNGSLARYAWAIVDCEKTYGVNAFFLTALIAHESSWGQSNRAINQNNLTGHAVYNTKSRGSNFKTRDDSIYNTAELLKNEYLTPGGNYHLGYSLYNVNTKYCLTEDSSAPDYKWQESINSIAVDIKNKYHAKVKRLMDVPEMDINIEEELKSKKKELLEAY